jgi:putative flippase GtrA
VSAEPHLPLPAELPLVDESGTANDGPEGGSVRNHEGIRERRSSNSTDLDLRTQVIRFALSGGLSAIVDFGIYAVLFQVVGLPQAVSKSISFICGTTTAYLINRRWTFQAPPSRSRFLAVVVLYAVTFAVQVGINQIVYHTLPDQWWRICLAFVVAQGTATVINFIVQRAVIFKIR